VTRHTPTIRGRLIDTAEFPATAAGYDAMLRWLQRHGTIAAVGVEGTGAYGAGLARHLHAHDVTVLEVPRPDRRLRRQHGKSDPIDAEAAARAVLAGTATVLPKRGDGPIEALRALRVARNGAIKAKTAATNALQAMVITAPEPIRRELAELSTRQLVLACTRLRPDTSRLEDPTQALKAALRSIARRADALTDEARQLERQLHALTRAAAPATTAVFALGPDTASALLVSIGDNPDRLRSEASFAHLCGVAPIPASSGKTQRHRLHRGGDRSANRALHIAVVVRMRYCQRTRAYVARRTAEGLSKPEIIRCIKRYLAREAFIALRADLAAMAP
jgi:transposase